jgi:glutathione S-transferase
MAPHFVLEEMGIDYKLQLVDRKSNAHKSDDYLALNPTGRIPTLVDNGSAIFESAAICLHLCDSNPALSLMPEIGDINRPLFYQWLMYLNNTVQAELMLYFYPEKHSDKEADINAIVNIQEQRITDMFALLDNELAGKDYLVGDSITVCDYFLFMLAVWADEFKKPPLSFQNLSRYLKKLAKRNAVIDVCEKENLSLAGYG